MKKYNKLLKKWKHIHITSNYYHHGHTLWIGIYSFKMHCGTLLSSQTLLQLLANIHNFKLCRAFSDVMTHDIYNWVEFNLIHPLSLSTFKNFFQRSLLPEKKKKFFQFWVQLVMDFLIDGQISLFCPDHTEAMLF